MKTLLRSTKLYQFAVSCLSNICVCFILGIYNVPFSNRSTRRSHLDEESLSSEIFRGNDNSRLHSRRLFVRSSSVLLQRVQKVFKNGGVRILFRFTLYRVYRVYKIRLYAQVKAVTNVHRSRGVHSPLGHFYTLYTPVYVHPYRWK